MRRTNYIFLLSITFLLFIHSYANAQTIISEAAGSSTTVNVVGGEVFADPNDGLNGGLGGICNVTNSEDLGDYPNCDCITTTTLCAPAGKTVTLTFTEFRVFGNFDWLAIFDGNASITSTNSGGSATNPASLDATLWNSSVDGDELMDMTVSTSATFTSSSECMTIISRFSGVVNTCGWEADVIVPSSSLEDCSELFFSEYMEGSDQNRCLEIFNPTTETVTLTDVYDIAIAENGGPQNRFVDLDGSISPGGTFVICDPDQDLGVTTDQEDNDVFFSGDDAIALRKNGENVDIIGQIGFDPGNFWGTGDTRTKEKTIRRKSSVSIGDTNGSDAFDPTVEWDGFVQNTIDGFGSHTTDNCVQCDLTAPVANTATKAFCQNEDLAANLANTGINVSNSLSANEKVVWVMTSAPANSPYSVETQLTTDDCGDPFKNFGTFAVANTSKVLRVNDIANAVPGTYTFDAYIENCETGCVSELTSGFSITVNEMPSVMITADLPIGIGRDLCLGQEGVQYGADITSTDGGTYTFAWCAYNSGDGSGTCFNGFDDNTSATPSRDWTSSAGTKSVGVAVTSDVAGCEAEDLYSFEVVAPTIVECPDDIMATLVTDPSTFDCATDITFNNPSVEAGPCDPVNLTIEITGPSGAGPEMVTPGEEYVFTVEKLGTYTVTYNLSDAVGNTSSCSFDIIVGGLPCGWVDDGGIGECAGMNSSAFDQGSEAFSVTSNGCVPEFPHIADEQAFVYTQLCGDGSIKVFVDDISAKGIAGIQLRESVAPGSKKVEISTDRIARLFRAVRLLDDYPAFPQQILSFDKFWLKIERTGNTFRAFASVDDVNYIPYVFQTIQMEECLVAGMFATSTNDEDVVTANFTNVEVIESGTDLLQAAPQTIAQSEKANELTIGLAPNPAKDQVSLNLDQLIGEAATISIFNINGQLMNSIQYDSVEDATATIDISNLPAGTYYVNVKTTAIQQTLKLIKQ